MNEKELALELKERYEDALQQFEHLVVPCSVEKLKQNNLDFEKLKQEVEALGYKLKYAKDIKQSYWQNEWKKNPLVVFYQSDDDI